MKPGLQKMKRRRTLIVISVAALIGAAFVVPLFSPWSQINCQVYELDLASGQQRVTRFIYWIPVSRKIKETAASIALGDDPRNHAEPHFVRTSTFGPFTSHSPHYVYHSASHQVKMLELVWEEFYFDADERKKSAQELLQRLKTSGSDSVGDEYLRELASLEEHGSVGNGGQRR